MLRPMKKLRSSHNDDGFALPLTLVAAAILIVIVSGMATLIIMQSRQTKLLEARSEIDFIRDSINLLMASPQSCSCQLDPSVNTMSAANLRVNTTLSSPPDISLQEFRIGCDFTNPDRAFLRTGSIFHGSLNELNVDAIEITDITSLGSLAYTSNLVLRFSIPSGQSLSLTMPFQFSVDGTTGTPNSRPTSACGVTAGGKTACPTGWQLVGEPGTFGNFCIERNRRPADDQTAAIQNCGLTQPPGFGRAKLCDHPSLINACRLGGVSNIAGSGEWTSVFYIIGTGQGLIGGVGSCLGHSYAPLTQAVPYRCCLF